MTLAIFGGIFVIVMAVGVSLLVRFVSNVFGEKPISGEDDTRPTATMTPTPEPWDPNQVPELTRIIATSEVMSLSYERVRGAAGYEVSFRSEEGDWQQVIASETDCFIPINSGFTYHVKVRSVSRTGDYGPYSQEGVVSAEAVRPSVRVDAKNGSSITFSWPLTREGADYTFSYKATDDEEWNVLPLSQAKITIGGLVKGKQYDVVVEAHKEDFATLRSEIATVVPEGTDFGDPFINAYALLRVGDQVKSVSYTAKNGCLGVRCWAQFKTALYSDVALTHSIGDVPGGTVMDITLDPEGRYVCEQEGNRFSVYVSTTIGGEKKEGWTLANALFVDLAMIFPQSNLYSIHYDRTNAYESLFTCGGDAQKVDLKSEADTRVEPLKAKDGAASLKVTGYNEIDKVTGKALPNYGSKEQMPAVWDVAIQLLTAQRNALAKGRCLLIYEAYRPNATSKLVYNAMTGNEYFKIIESERTLANGFLNKNYTEAYFIANNSNHNKGIALDLTIMGYDSLEKLGKELEMQTKMHTLDYRCDMTYNNKAANELYSIMTTGTGLVPLKAKQEWWHFELSSDVSKFPCIKNYGFANYKI